MRIRQSGEYAAACLGAVMVAGVIYVGVLLLNDAPLPQHTDIIEGAIRLAQPARDNPAEKLKPKKLKEAEPPKPLPKTFSSKPKTARTKPIMRANIPSFSADIHPGLGNGIALPSGDFGSIGFRMDEVDQVPRVLRSVPPEYPYGAKRNHIEGKVVVQMLVTSKGQPVNLTIHSSTPAGVFDKTALNAAKRWKFQPGTYKGQAVDTWVLLPFNFELSR